MRIQEDNQRWRVLAQVMARVTPRSIVEIGLLRVDSEAHRLGDGHATRFFYDYIAEHPEVSYVGVDLDPCAVGLCSGLFCHAAPQMTFINAEACNVLGQSVADFLYLDGGDDPKDMILQFLAAGDAVQTVVCDDTFRQEIRGHTYWVGKAAGLMPLLEALGWEVTLPEDYVAVAYRGAEGKTLR